MTDDTVLYEVSKGVARIILNRPAVNALNLEMIKGVVAALETAAKDESIRAVVLASAVSKAFPLDSISTSCSANPSKKSADSFRSFTSDFTTPSTIWASLPSRPLEARRVAVG
jgi:1,4-dihydroxy-2-naphthoyl-CoA synthase